MSLVGSVMWVMPSKRERFLADLRLRAKRMGFQVQLIKLQYPRARKELEGERKSSVAYRLTRTDVSRDQHTSFASWRVLRCDTNASEGLCEGWGWALGERTLSAQALVKLNTLLQSLPDNVLGLESTPVHASAYWREEEALSLQSLHDLVNQIITLEL
ncbi:MAG: hypothetical protein ACPG4U_09920 [Pseudomonadales bacterium]